MLSDVNSVELVNVSTTGTPSYQLYASSSSSTAYNGVETVGPAPAPTSGSSQTLTSLLSGASNKSVNATGFFFTKLNPASTGDDTLYVADPSVGISKYSLVGTTWRFNGTVGSASDAYRSVTATVTGTTVTLYAISDASSSGGELVSLVDSTGYSGGSVNFSPTVTPIVAAGSLETFRGVALAPTVVANNQPTINTVAPPAPIPPNSGRQTVTLSGISDGDNGTQILDADRHQQHQRDCRGDDHQRAGDRDHAHRTGDRDHHPHRRRWFGLLEHQSATGHDFAPRQRRHNGGGDRRGGQ